MRADLRPYWLKKSYLNFRHWYAEYFLRPECASLGAFHTIMKPWYVHISGNNIDIGKCFTAIAEPGRAATVDTAANRPMISTTRKMKRQRIWQVSVIRYEFPSLIGHGRRCSVLGNTQVSGKCRSTAIGKWSDTRNGSTS